MTPHPIYTVDHFIAKFEAEPEESWWAGVCTVGERRVFRDLFGGYVAIARINDGLHPAYRQPTPKARILAALRDVKDRSISGNPACI